MNSAAKQHADVVLSLRRVSAHAAAQLEQERRRSTTVKDDGQCHDLNGV